MLFSLPIRVYWEDTDAGGVVYHASYLCFLERARSEWLRSLGHEQQRLRDDEDLVLAVREMRIDFMRPARLDDALVVTLDAVLPQRASLVIRQSIFRGDQCLVGAETRVACLVASTFRPRPLPQWLAAVHPVTE